MKISNEKWFLLNGKCLKLPKLAATKFSFLHLKPLQVESTYDFSLLPIVKYYSLKISLGCLLKQSIMKQYTIFLNQNPLGLLFQLLAVLASVLKKSATFGSISHELV